VSHTVERPSGETATHTIGEVARLAGITVRTLHHYDEVGLLRPSGRSRSGYRSYDAADIARLQRVLGYRELDFSLEEIGALLDGEADPLEHLHRQRDLISLRIERLQRMLATLDRTMEAQTMGFRLTPAEMLEVFGEHDPAEHHAEAEQRWGDTEAWRESQGRISSYGKEDWLRLKADAEAIHARLATALTSGLPAGSDEAMDAAEAHRRHINDWFYECSPQMHVGLAEMYLADPRFTATYEGVAPGLAQYLHDAILANAARARA